MQCYICERRSGGALKNRELLKIMAASKKGFKEESIQTEDKYLMLKRTVCKQISEIHFDEEKSNASKSIVQSDTKDFLIL